MIEDLALVAELDLLKVEALRRIADTFKSISEITPGCIPMVNIFTELADAIENAREEMLAFDGDEELSKKVVDFLEANRLEWSWRLRKENNAEWPTGIPKI